MLKPGHDVALVGYGPVLLSNAWHAADELAAKASSAAVINLPWLNRIDDDWVSEVLGRFPLVVTLDNHYVTLGQGVMIAAALARNRQRADVRSLGLTDVPACGTNAEVLAHHGLDAPRRLRRPFAHVSTPSPSLDRRRRGRPSARARRSRSRSAARSTISVLAQVARGTAADVTRGGGRRRGRRRRVGPTAGAASRRDSRSRGRRCSAPKSASSARSSRPKPASPGRTRSPKSARRRILRVFMESEGSRFYGKTMTSPIAESHGPHGARADRRVRRDHAVQQPARRHRLESVSGASVRQRRRRQVARADAVHRGRVRTSCCRKPACRAACIRRCRGSVPKSARRSCATTASASSASPARPPPESRFRKTVSERRVLAKVCLELGGKNPLVVCDDADLTLAAEHAVASAFVDAGQRCASGSRIIVVPARLRRLSRRPSSNGPRR